MKLSRAVLSLSFILAAFGNGTAGAHRLSATAGLRGEPAAGTIEVSFLYLKAEGTVPSYQTAIWLESEEVRYVKTLFLSEYLSLGGYNHEYVCPAWVKQADWEKADESEYEAVTRPTPPIGSSTLRFDCRERGIAPGTYRLCIQAHIVERYNILYRSRIVIGPEASESEPEVFHSPAKHPDASDILSGVRFRYVPK
ncbi:MAG: DUF2271 domain-containing protein [Acidobacteria bacterium]|nr:DUF2271 domain-containing protein [Acidobacteriota bacterium]